MQNLHRIFQFSRLSIFAFILALFAAHATSVDAAESSTDAKTSDYTPDHDGYCNDSAENTFICERFIEGFLEGALLTDAAIIKSLEDNEPKSFTERAMATRGGGRFDDQPTALAGFCLPEGYTVHGIARKILGKIEAAHVDSDRLGVATYEALKKHYRCPDGKQSSKP